MKNVSSLFMLLFVLGLGSLRAQEFNENAGNALEFITEIAQIKEINSILFSYEHNSQRTLYVLNNETFREHLEMDGCRVEIDLGELPIFVECYKYIRDESIYFYVQFDDVSIHKHSATVEFSTQGASPKGVHLKGTVHFHREDENSDWTVRSHHIKEIKE